jgi:hypothetical protein
MEVARIRSTVEVTGTGAIADRIECEDFYRWRHNQEPLTDAEAIDLGVKDHPALAAYCDAVSKLWELWDAMPACDRIKAEYRCHNMRRWVESGRRHEIPHVEYAEHEEVWT